jgi:hypothetical protein
VTFRPFLAVALVLVGAAFSTHGAAAVTHATGLCPARFTGPTWTHSTTGVTGSKYEVSTIGPLFSCKATTKWVKKFITEHAGSQTSPTILKNGPKGYTCKGLGDKQGRAFSGSCLKLGASPSGFGWSPIK